MKAPVREIFCSIQGEGPYTGVRQAFIRFSGCNLECVYCDTPVEYTPKCRVETIAGTQEFSDIKNPLSTADVSREVERYEGLHSTSLTGGEPLLYADFISDLNLISPLYLETNMSLPKHAKKVKDKIRYVAGDFKLETCQGSDNYGEYFDDMVKCFRVLRSTARRDCFCKVVICEGFDRENLLEGASKIRDYISMIVLQPVTQREDADAKPVLVKEMMEVQEMLLDIKDTRIIPQSHKMWGAL